MDKEKRTYLFASAFISLLFANVMTVIEATFNPLRVSIPLTIYTRSVLYPILAVLILWLLVADRKWSWLAKLVPTSLTPFAIYITIDLLTGSVTDYFNFSWVAVVNWLTPISAAFGIAFVTFKLMKIH